MVKDNINVLLRTAEAQDLPDIVQIENQIQITPWPLSVFEISLFTDEFYWVAVDQTNNKLIGFLICAIYSPEADLTNFGIAFGYQNQGIGTKLLNQLWQYLAAKKVTKITLEVRESNTRAIKLYKKNNFKTVNKRRNYYRAGIGNDRENGLIMTKYL